MIRSRFIGDRAFYRKTLRVMTPVLVQNVITNFVSLLDTSWSAAWEQNP